MLLEKTQLVFYKILFVIWQLTIYYEELLGYEAPIDLMDMYTELIHIGKYSFIHVELIACMDEKKYCDRQIKEMLQEYLNIVLLPQSEVPPYSSGDEVVESLYLQSVRYDIEKGKMNFDFLYINNPASYQLYKEDVRIG